MVVFGFWFLLLDFVFFCVVEVEPKVTVEVPLRSGCPLSCNTAHSVSPAKNTRVGFRIPPRWMLVKNGSLNFSFQKRSDRDPVSVSSTTGLLSFATIIIAGELNGFITWWSAAEGWPPWRWSGRVTTKF